MEKSSTPGEKQTLPLSCQRLKTDVQPINWNLISLILVAKAALRA